VKGNVEKIHDEEGLCDLRRRKKKWGWKVCFQLKKATFPPYTKKRSAKSSGEGAGKQVRRHSSPDLWGKGLRGRQKVGDPIIRDADRVDDGKRKSNHSRS